ENNSIQTEIPIPSAEEQAEMMSRNDRGIDSDKEREITQDFAKQLERAKNQSFKTTEDESDERFVGVVKDRGWFRNDQLYQIVYRPTGHADDYLKTMMEIVAQSREADANPATAPFFKKMTSQYSVGACARCHTVDAVQDQKFQINWKAEYRSPWIRSFTKFSHGPHVSQPMLSDCTTCHSMDESVTNAESFKSFYVEDRVSNFRPMTKSNCTNCHFESGTDSGCTQCHSYHVGSKILAHQ
ncbi:MAG: hypothetical protein AAGA30_04000, partial [Planctomycetota bacterium]